ncbi:hypothetical protein RFI_05854 [Reticulomyxa filosa]|uniref:Uncharacterized protein n=1 Tax=Reticulomyxa filosa TaxID=46433 RepID=X6NZ71_RETFI|nr:hypothetical protein RFI_05854 [Reticulomyxa filosa]|eukprot:ETO31266.1 hypothetical protein RFI_05854 [Reticulomyxa filosa]
MKQPFISINSTTNEIEEKGYKTTSEENHKNLGEIVKSVVYGGLDGIITTFAIVSSVHGANLPQAVVLVVGFANVIANAFSMGIGDYLSESAEFDYARSERNREKWEFENFKEGEIMEMVEIYEKKGMISKNKKNSKKNFF